MKILGTVSQHAARALGLAAIVSLPAALCASAASAASPSADDQMHENWRAMIAGTATPGAGCFTAAYPSAVWKAVACTTAPTRPYIPAHGIRHPTVGNGNDYAAVVSGLMSSAVGSFPTVTGVKSETGYGGQPNTYSLQLNSGFMTTAACNGHSGCLSWEQFVYSSSSDAAFMQYWLINYGNSCSGGWNSYQGSCYKNSRAVGVPLQVITQLHNLKLSGKAVRSGIDTLVLTTANNAYSTTGNDSVVDLATAWDASEFNVVGDGGGSSAKFNKGSSVTVQIALTHGSSSAPTCEPNDGTTGETNNLNLKGCTTSGGSTPSIKFVESN